MQDGVHRTDTIILPRRLNRLCGQRRCYVGHQLFAGFIQAHLWMLRIVRSPIDLQHVFHGSYEFRVAFLRQDPMFLQPRLDLVFFSV
jgi:hypothetical protein